MLSKIKLAKKTFAIFLTFMPCLVFCQHIKRCGTIEYWEQKKLNDPTLVVAEAKAKSDAESWKISHSFMSHSSAVIIVPVVVHVLYHTNAENISDAQIESQIDVLNDDFSKLNIDVFQVPSDWSSIAADTKIQFCLASLKPDSTSTNGIERSYTTRTAWEIWELDSMKHSSYGGLDAWNRDYYLNIWVANIAGGLLGITQLPGGPASSDGMTIQYTAFGRTGHVKAPYHKGRTTTHEAGHWLGLSHVWGDDNATCSGSDFMNDTPNQTDATYGCPSFPLLDACSPVSPGIMFMNYMDYTDDLCMHMFTHDQAALMNAVLHTSRASIQNSNACTATSTKEFIRVYYPGPGTIVQIRISFASASLLEVTLTDMLGRPVIQKTLYPEAQAIISLNEELDFTSIPNGIYVLSLNSTAVSETRKISIQH